MERYTKTDWVDHIVDAVTGEVIENGTRFTASRANNWEHAIEHLFNVRFPQTDVDITKIRIQLEMLGRAPVNNGTFYSTLDGGAGKALTILANKAVLQVAQTAGATILPLDNVPFFVGDVIVIADDVKSEYVTVTAVSAIGITVSATVNAYKKGAFVTRTNSVIDSEQQSLLFGNWTTYTVEVS